MCQLLQCQAMPGCAMFRNVPRPAAAATAAIFQHSILSCKLLHVKYTCCSSSIMVLYYTFLCTLACTYVSAALSVASQISHYAEAYDIYTTSSGLQASNKTLAQLLMLLSPLKMYHPSHYTAPPDTAMQSGSKKCHIWTRVKFCGESLAQLCTVRQYQ